MANERLSENDINRLKGVVGISNAPTNKPTTESYFNDKHREEEKIMPNIPSLKTQEPKINNIINEPKSTQPITQKSYSKPRQKNPNESELFVNLVSIFKDIL